MGYSEPKHFSAFIVEGLNPPWRDAKHPVW